MYKDKSWEEDLTTLFSQIGDSWDNVEACAPPREHLRTPFNHGFGGSEGCPFTVWTKQHVYFPVVYDGSEWVGFVSRNPDGKPTNHQGGE